MDEYSLKPAKSTLRFLVQVTRVTKELILIEFGQERASKAKIYFSRKMYFTLGRCWPAEDRIAYNLAWVVLNRKEPKFIWGLIVHEVAHLIDPNHGEKFLTFCEKYHVTPESISGGRNLPPAAWLLCSTCGDNQGVLFSTRLTPEVVGAKFSGMRCRKCGAEVEYRELSDKSFKRVSWKIKKLRIYGTKTWETIKALAS